VAELEALGYVERRPDPSDRRGKLVFLTPRGAAVRPTAMATGRLVEAHWSDLTSPQDVATLKRLLSRLLTQLETEFDAELPAPAPPPDPEAEPEAKAGE
jgi:DNA-binding MarR family transcriptional regulator